ncbi:MAG: flagellar biosynthesis protein FlhF [Campylobacterota bacterium]|nr:flagellar biosynthesis protein FlhF [Campylobacterota bacterium]
MINVTLVAPTPQEAYELAKEKYGKDFTLISAKQIRHNTEEAISCEITVAVSKDSFLQISDEDEEMDGGLMDELAGLREQISLMKEHLQEREEKRHSLIEEVEALFVKKGIAKEWLERVLAPLVGTTVAGDKELLVAYLLEEIDETLKLKEEDLSRKKVMMFVGPTGVGKTTTIAKLAARYAYLMEKPYKVALVNLDSFKVGAFEQLAHYADIMQLKYVTANNTAQFEEIFGELEEYDVVLIDTAGMSPYDTEKLVKTVEYLSSGKAQTIEVNLVISSTVKYEDLEDIHGTFSFLNLDSVILSKFDETKHLGTVLSYLLLYPTPLSYFSVGQDVPDDLLSANKEYLLQRFIGDLDA